MFPTNIFYFWAGFYVNWLLIYNYKHQIHDISFFKLYFWPSWVERRFLVWWGICAARLRTACRLCICVCICIYPLDQAGVLQLGERLAINKLVGGRCPPTRGGRRPTHQLAKPPDYRALTPLPLHHWRNATSVKKDFWGLSALAIEKQHCTVPLANSLKYLTFETAM